MLSECRVVATMPVKDLAAAKQFYEDKLGLKVLEEQADGVSFECAGGTVISVFPSSGSSNGSFTQAGWECDDVAAEMEFLRSRGVTFEQYDMPGFTSDERGLVETEGLRGAWFKDPEGNLLSIFERPS